MYKSTKTFTHAQGLSCCFRQWRAESHCRFLHGYALQIVMVFRAEELDERGWVVDFGSLKGVKEWLQDNFDHKTLVAADDPHLDLFRTLDNNGLIEMVVLPMVGCEAFAKHVFTYVRTWITIRYGDRVQLESVEVREHGGNSAICCQ